MCAVATRFKIGAYVFFRTDISSPVWMLSGAESFKRHPRYAENFNRQILILSSRAKNVGTVSNKNTHLADFETCVFRG